MPLALVALPLLRIALLSKKIDRALALVVAMLPTGRCWLTFEVLLDVSPAGDGAKISERYPLTLSKTPLLGRVCCGEKCGWDGDAAYCCEDGC